VVNWRVDVLNQSVVGEIDALPPDMRAKLDHIVRMIEELGLHQVREPYIKALRGKLWEIRIKGRDGIARAIYVTVKERRIVILHAFRKKTRKTPEAAIRTALSRMKELEP
jgi:phage-related protein